MMKRIVHSSFLRFSLATKSNIRDDSVEVETEGFRQRRKAAQRLVGDEGLKGPGAAQNEVWCCSGGEGGGFSRLGGRRVGGEVEERVKGNVGDLEAGRKDGGQTFSVGVFGELPWGGLTGGV